MPEVPAAPQQPGRVSSPAALLSIVLQAHLPFVVNHGTWPHGMEWLHEAAAETYLPLLQTLADLERDGIPVHLNLVLSPVLLEQLAHPVFLAEFPRYLDRKITAAHEDQAYFEQAGELHYSYLARLWRDRFFRIRAQFDALGGSILAGIRHFQQSGALTTFTSSATHGYLPLLGTDESLRAQVELAVRTHHRHLGRAPAGIWSPECGYRPAGPWQQPVSDAPGTDLPPATDRPGLEAAFARAGLDLFFVDTHLVEHGDRHPLQNTLSNIGNPLYRPLIVAGPDGPTPVAAFPRDPITATQVWSADGGYPGEPAYLDFYKKRWPGGHRYWRVTDWHTDMAHKEPYIPEAAAERVAAHAEHFLDLVLTAVGSTPPGAPPPVLTAPYDAELFGHWWFEGARWLDLVARALHARTLADPASPRIELTSARAALAQHPPTDSIRLPEGSWGAGGDNRVWLNDETSWVWQAIYAAEHDIRTLCSTTLWQSRPEAARVLRQLCRELLLLESSDWPFLITTGAARDYAEARIRTHLDQYAELRALWSTTQTAPLSPAQLARLAAIEQRDDLFPDLDPALWATR